MGGPAQKQKDTHKSSFVYKETEKLDTLQSKINISVE